MLGARRAFGSTLAMVGTARAYEWQFCLVAVAGLEGASYYLAATVGPSQPYGSKNFLETTLPGITVAGATGQQ
jgi:hypothetical protein